MEIEGTIESKKFDKEGVGKTGQPWKRWIIRLNGTDYSTFDEVIYNKFNPGDAVRLHGEQKGAYFNMKSIEPLDKAPEVQKIGERNDLAVYNAGYKKGNGSMYASYAKDVFIELYHRFITTAPTSAEVNTEEIMKDAIEVVKQAKEAFE